ncbi:hypothetical protein A0O34_00440 [Chryseobacterium glaciei]|uniref:Bulb-type lectin domain-containing protein n=1 Tax=Chryseobacterium glaciei TaxID=1685010 RepID=A0A172XQC7_9FLAO|nr:hypothetical protein [Chryseobacterium glaciei]ANF49114.1 hypothetical protein A0O34_00440 [Chryseobacterium glaciei]
MGKIKNTLTTLFLCIVQLCVVQYSQAQAVGTPYMPQQEVPIPFSFLNGGDAGESTEDVQNTTDGGYITIGSSQSRTLIGGGVVSGAGANHGQVGNYDWIIIKYNKLGKIEWQRFYGGDQNDWGRAIKQTSDGGYIMTGFTAASGSGDVPAQPGSNPVVMVVKLDTSGAITWQVNIGSGTLASGRTILQNTDLTYIVGFDIGAVKLNSAGNIIWQYNAAAGNSMIRSLIATSDGTGYIMAGYGSSTSFLIVKINLTGALVWQKNYGGSGQEEATEVTPMPDGGCIVVGMSLSSASGNVTGTNHGGNDVWVMRLDISGNIVWQQLLGGSGNEYGYSVTKTADGGLMVGAYSSSSANGNVTGTNNGAADVWLIKLSTAGAIQWQRLYGGADNDGALPGNVALVMNSYRPSLVRVRETSEGNFIVLAPSASSNSSNVTDTNNGVTDMWLFKIDPSGNIISVPNIGQ